VGFVADCHQDSDGPGQDPTTCEIVRKKWIEERSDDTMGLFQSACGQPMAALCFGSIPDLPQRAIRNVEPGSGNEAKARRFLLVLSTGPAGGKRT
jgi:hypothetical protein